MNKKMVKARIRKAIEENPNRDYFKRVKLFGSYLHSRQNAQSDIDLLVDFAITPGIFRLGAIGEDLEEKLGRKVDLVTPQSLSKYFREQVMKEAELIYEK